MAEGLHILRNPLRGTLDASSEDWLSAAVACVDFKLDTEWTLRPARVGVGEPPPHQRGRRAYGVLSLQFIRLHERIECLPDGSIESLVHRLKFSHVGLTVCSRFGAPMQHWHVFDLRYFSLPLPEGRCCGAYQVSAAGTAAST